MKGPLSIGLYVPQLTDVADDTLPGLSVYLWLIAALFLILFVISALLLLQIRKRQQLTSRLERMRREALALYDRAACGYHAVNAEGVFTNVNDTFCQWLGYEKSELVSKMKFEDVVEADPAALKQTVERVQAGETVETVLVKKGGDKFHVTLKKFDLQALATREGIEVYSTQDDNRCHDALERIKTLDQELDSFSYSISHDLRAPLRSIDGYSRILREDFAEHLGEEGRRVLGVIMKNTQRMGTLIDGLLEYGRLNRKMIKPVHLDMSAIVNELVQELHLKYSDRNIEVRIEELQPAVADPEMIRVVWMNLLDNAFKFSANQNVAKIDVRSYDTGSSEICYEVKDNGVGFDMQYAGKLFGVFQRLHRVRDFSGTGVGLAMVKRIIDRHGGRTWAEGSLELGSVFYFTLPERNGNT